MPANQAGKGPQPRAYNTTKFATGWDRIFGKKQETQMGAEPREGSAGAPMNWEPPATMHWAPDPKPEPFTPYQVPVIEDPTFGSFLRVPLPEDRLVIVLQRGSAGWHTPVHLRHVRLSHQIYTKDVRPTPELDSVREIVVVGLNTGTWVTVWASAPGEITHPHQANTP